MSDFPKEEQNESRSKFYPCQTLVSFPFCGCFVQRASVRMLKLSAFLAITVPTIPQQRGFLPGPGRRPDPRAMNFAKIHARGRPGLFQRVINRFIPGGAESIPWPEIHLIMNVAETFLSIPCCNS